MPFAGAVEHFANVLADVAGAFGIGLEAAGDVGMFKRFFDAEENGFGGEEAFLGADDGGFDCGCRPLHGQVFRRRKWNGFCVHDQNLAGGVGLERGGIF